MKGHAYILIFLVVFLSLSERTYAGIDSSSLIDRKDTTKCVTLYFEENERNLDEYFASNLQSLSTLDSLLRQCSDNVDSFEWEIKSYTCFKGDTEQNRKLALLRTESVKYFLQKRCLNIDTLRMNFFSEGEDWDGFRAMVAADPNLPDKDEVLMLIDYHADNIEKRKELIKKLDRGVPYKYIVQKVWPELRRSEVTITWKNSEKADEVKQIAKTVISNSNPTGDIGQVIKVESKEPAPVIIPVSEEKKEKKCQTVLAIKNNLLYDLALAPNIEVEIPIGKRWSFNTEYKCPWWMNNRHGFCYQLLSGGVEARIWLGNRQKRNKLTGHFLGLYAEGGIYDFQFGEDKGYQGKYYGASGLTYGYGVQLARHFSMEFSLGVGYLTTEYKKYVPYEGDIVWNSSGRYNFFGPTKLKVSLVWLLTKGR